MDIQQAVEVRRSVRSFTSQPIELEAIVELQASVDECNAVSGLNMQLRFGETRGFSGLRGFMVKNAVNYLAIVGKDNAVLEELGGYWGEKLVLRATQLGLGSLWFGMGSKKEMVAIARDERLLISIILGYAAKASGSPRKTKPAERLYLIENGNEPPEWFLAGIRATQLAPTARNQQCFRITLLEDGKVKAESLGGMMANIDLGIVKCHFEIGAGTDNFAWV